MASADTMQEKLKIASHVDGPQFKIKNDPRVNNVGRFLRETGIDEIPQFINVLKGEMSLVGPRPERAYFIEQLKEEIPWYIRRIKMKPGITGIWQCNGRSTSQYEHLIAMDLKYVDNWSLLLDFKLLIKTIPVVIRCIGAM